MVIETWEYESPCGVLVLGALEGKLCLCDWRERTKAGALYTGIEATHGARMVCGASPVIRSAVEQLDEYFRGARQVFDVPIIYSGTEFQQRVWMELETIPYGVTVTYKALAQRLRQPAAVRAVANAVGANPLSIFVPCHRIIGSNGTLTGYAGGLEAKQFLLRLESFVFE